MGDKIVSSVIEEVNKTWMPQCLWVLNDFNITEESLTASYKFDLESSCNSLAPHKFLVHGTDTYIVAMYQMIIHCLYLYKNGAFPKSVSKSVSEKKLAELRRRLMITKTELIFKKPIFTNEIEVTSSVSKYTQKNNLFFGKVNISVNNDSHIIKNHGVLNMRDELI